ncbi:hypothetical protein [Streptomyces vastus]
MEAVRTGVAGLGAREDLHGARDVETLDALEEDDEHGSGCHVLDSWRAL